MNRTEYIFCWLWAFAIVLTISSVVVLCVAHKEAHPNHERMFIYVGANCKAGPLVLSEDDTDPALEDCRRVDTHEIDRPQ
jgi:hypothetical protein